MSTTFLLTKPAHQAKNLCTQIEKLGGRCILFPTVAIQTLADAEIRIAIASSSDANKIIFTSSNAVHPVMPYWEKFKNAIVFAVGSGTAKTLADFHIAAKVPVEFNSEGLLALPELQTVYNQNIIIFSGVGGRMLLVNELEKRGAKVQKIAVYKRTCPVMNTPFPPVEKITCIISTSEESLQNLWQMAGESGQAWLKEQQLLVISPKMQILAEQLGFKYRPIVASNASDAAILQALSTTSAE